MQHMKVYEAGTGDIAEQIIKSLEKDTGQKVFTARVLESIDDENIEMLIVFEDKSVLMAFITVQEIDGKLATRLRGNFLE